MNLIKSKSLIIKSENGLETKEEFYTYTFEINIPAFVREDVGREREKSKITMSFPLIKNDQLDNSSLESIPIFASLPVQDIGFRFLLNCDWILVTNRESIAVNSWNENF